MNCAIASVGRSLLLQEVVLLRASRCSVSADHIAVDASPAFVTYVRAVAGAPTVAVAYLLLLAHLL